jgi:hypothetical protein
MRRRKYEKRSVQALSCLIDEDRELIVRYIDILHVRRAFLFRKNSVQFNLITRMET